MDIEDEQDKEKVCTKLTLCLLMAFMFKDWFLSFAESKLSKAVSLTAMSGSPGLV